MKEEKIIYKLYGTEDLKSIFSEILQQEFIKFHIK